MIGSGSIAGGVLTPPIPLERKRQGVQIAIGAYAGLEGVFGIRSIEDRSSGCRSEDKDIDLRGGSYVEPTLYLYIPWSISASGLSISYRSYNKQADIKNRLIVSLFVTLPERSE